MARYGSLYREPGGVRPGAIAVTPDEFDSLRTIVADHSKISRLVAAQQAQVGLLRQALQNLHALAHDPAGSTLPLKAVFGTFHSTSQFEGQFADRVLKETTL